MDRSAIDSPASTSRVVYTCWPFGGLLCGLATMGIGLLILVDYYLEAPAEVLWGVGLIVLGGAVIMWSRDREDWV